MAISIDSTSTGNDTTAGTTITFAHTVNSGSDSIIIVQTLALNTSTGGNEVVSGVTFNGDALTKEVAITSGDLGGVYLSCEIWYRVAPDVATGNVVATYSGSVAEIGASAISAFGVAQTSPVDDSDTAVHSSTTTHSISLTTTEANNLLCDACYFNVASGISVLGSQTQQLDPDAAGTGRGTSYVIAGAAGANAIGWSSGTNDSFHCAASFKPATEAPVTGIASLRQLVGHGRGTRA